MLFSNVMKIDVFSLEPPKVSDLNDDCYYPMKWAISFVWLVRRVSLCTAIRRALIKKWIVIGWYFYDTKAHPSQCLKNVLDWNAFNHLILVRRQLIQTIYILIIFLITSTMNYDIFHVSMKYTWTEINLSNPTCTRREIRCRNIQDVGLHSVY